MQQKKINNFIKPKGVKLKTATKKKKILIIVLLIITFILIFFGVTFLIIKKPAQLTYEYGLAGKDNFFKAQDQLLTQDFENASISLGQAIINFELANQQFQKIKWLKFVPWLGSQISALDNLLLAGIETGQSIKKVNDLANGIITPLQKDHDLSLSSMSEEETRQLLEQVFNAKPDLELAKQSIDKAVNYINKIPDKGLINQITEIADLFKEKTKDLQAALDQAISASQIIPSIAGYPDQKTYLFLLQNNTEMRPTGGFIGTYGILKVKNGDINSFNTDNTYNLDKPAEEWLNETPPWPLTKYNDVHRWFFRDSNWSPDFPTTAQTAERFYHLEKGPEKNIDGIIAVTPTFIQSLITLTGDIEVNGLTFNSKNLIDTLQYQVEQGFLRQGLPESERKEIIGVLSKKILDAVLDLPKSQWPELWQISSRDVSEKQILVYLKDNYTQGYILKENWGGAIKNTDNDYFSVIDANLASLKTDPAVNRTISYTLRRDSDNIIADLKITYENTGSITWKTTRYRTYTRIYVPKDSTLLKSEGSMVDCKLPDEGSVETTEELNKTVFGTFICVEPDESKSLMFKYKLPARITDQVKNGTYQLIAQKQAGTSNYPLHLSIDVNKKPKTIIGIDDLEIELTDNIKISLDLSKDQNIIINY